MKLITDNAFSNAWEIICPTCSIDNPNSILWFRKQCHDCVTKDIANKKYTEQDIINIVNKSRETGLTAEYLILQLNKQD
jgi:hypothetical protein